MNLRKPTFDLFDTLLVAVVCSSIFFGLGYHQGEMDADCQEAWEQGHATGHDEARAIYRCGEDL